MGKNGNVEIKENPEIDETPAADPMASLSPEIREEIKKMIAAGIEAGLEATRAQMKNAVSAAVAPEDEKAKQDREINEWLNERVPVRLFKDNGQYKDDVSIGWNGYPYKIQRGVDVEIPRGAYLILMQSLKQDEKTAMLIDQRALEFESEAKQRGIN